MQGDPGRRLLPGGPMDKVAQSVGIPQWPARPAEPAMAVHLPDGGAVTRWTDERRWQEHQDAFGVEALDFWRWQERTADALWDLALRLPPWPPQTAVDAARLLRHGAGWLSADLRRVHPGLFADACARQRRICATPPSGCDCSSMAN